MVIGGSTQGGPGQDLGEMFDLFDAPAAADTLVLASEVMRTGKSKPRGQVHRDGDWHSSIHVWVVDAKGRFLLQQRGADKDTNPSFRRPRQPLTAPATVARGMGLRRLQCVRSRKS